MTMRLAETLVRGTVIRTTERAVLIDLDGDETWIPRSVCRDGEHIDESWTEIEVANWWLRQEKLL